MCERAFSEERNVIGSVRPSLRLLVCFPLFLNRLIFDLDLFACVLVMTVARLGLKVKVKGHDGKTSIEDCRYSTCILILCSCINPTFIAVVVQCP